MADEFLPSQVCICCSAPANVLCAECTRRRCTFGDEKCGSSLLRAISERRNDEAFMARLRERIQQDGPLLLRMSDGECNSARLVESRDGGVVLIYECECGARLSRTRAQAEADASLVRTPAEPSQSPENAEGADRG